MTSSADSIMQLNDATDYSLVVGKTDGLIPSKYKGRGLVALDRVYEFQTAYCKDVEDIQDYLRGYCEELRSTATTFAKPIPVLPNTVDIEYVKPAIDGIKNVPVHSSIHILMILGISDRSPEQMVYGSATELRTNICLKSIRLQANSMKRSVVNTVMQ